MKIGSYIEPANLNKSTEPERNKKQETPSRQISEDKQSVSQKQASDGRNDRIASAADKKAAPHFYPPDLNKRIKRDADSEDGKINRQSSQAGYGNRLRSVDLIDVDPDSVTPEVQKQFRRFSEIVKEVKEDSPPDISRQAGNFIRDAIKKNKNIDVDPDKTYVNMFAEAEALHDGNDGVTGWQHNKKDIKESKTLTEFALGNFNDSWRKGTSDVLNLHFGIYNENSGANVYGANNEVKITPSELRAIIKDGDLENYLNKKQESFWSEQAQRWRALAKTEFSGLAKKAALDGQLTQQGYDLAMKGASPNVPLDQGAKVKQMRSEASADASAQVRRFDINGYSATDILRFSGLDGRQVLYIPGHEQAFHEFDSEDKLKDWVIGKTQEAAARRELASHFSLYDRSKGNWGALSATGVEEGLNNLASKRWNKGRIDTQPEYIYGDVFTDMAGRIRQRNKEDLSQITNSSDKRQMWLEDLKNSNTPLFARPIGRALSAGSFAASVGEYGGGVFATSSARGRQNIEDAAGMNVGLALLFVPGARASSSKPAPLRSRSFPNHDAVVVPDFQNEFSTPEFPVANAAGAINEIRDRMESITGPQNLRQYDSLSEMRRLIGSPGGRLRSQRIENSLDEVYRRLSAVDSRFKNTLERENIIKFLGRSLNTTDESALNQSYDRLRSMSSEAFQRFKMLKENDYNKITFFERLDKSKPLPENEKDASVSAFSNLKDRRRIMVNLEVPDEGVRKLSETEASYRYNVELVDSIMKQLTRVTGNTQDFMHVAKENTKDGFSLGTAKTALEEFGLSTQNDAVCRRALGKDPEYPDDSAVRDILALKGGEPITDHMRLAAKRKIDDSNNEYYRRKTQIGKYASMTEADRENVRKAIGRTFSDEQRQAARERIRQDSVLRADLMTSNADTATLYLRDIADNRSHDTPLPGVEREIPALVQEISAEEAKKYPLEFEYRVDGKRIAGYAVSNAYDELYIFPTMDEAKRFSAEQSWKHGFVDTLKNPLGAVAEAIGLAQGKQGLERKRLNQIGGNPIGELGAAAAGRFGANDDVKGKIKGFGDYVEKFIPGYGSVKIFGGLSAKALNGENPTVDDAQSASDSAKDIASGTFYSKMRPGSRRGDKYKSSSADDYEAAIPAGGESPDVKNFSAGRQKNIKKGTSSGGRFSTGNKFRENRGGDALASEASSYRKFNLSNFFNKKKSRADTLQGLPLEVMRRIDTDSAGKGDLFSAIRNIRRDVDKSPDSAKGLPDGTNTMPKNQIQNGFKKYRQEADRRYQGGREGAIRELESDIRNLRPQDVALMKMGVKGKGGQVHGEGAAIMVQRLRDQNYQLLDPNNGVFSYKSGDSVRDALGKYFGSAYKDKGEMYPETFTKYRYQTESIKLSGAGHDATTSAGRSGARQESSASSRTEGAPHSFGENYDFPYIDAEKVPDRSAVTPSAGSLHERDLQIQKEHALHKIPDPATSGYPSYINQLISGVKDKTGVVSSDLAGLQKIAYNNNTIISIRPVDQFATGLIESGYETKGFHIKGKSASWGPQAGLICADQRFSKLENSEPGRIDKFNAAIEKSVQDRDAVKVPLALSSRRLETLAKLGAISEMSARDSKGARTFAATAPSGKKYQFEATPRRGVGEELFDITSGHKPIEVLAPVSPGAKPFTADYDLFVVAPHISDVGPQDNLPVPDVAHGVFRDKVDRYKNTGGINPELRDAYNDPKKFYEKGDPEIGNTTERIRNLIPVINNELMLNAAVPRAKVVHHGAETSSAVTDPGANYPATFFLPFKMGRFDEIAVIHNQDDFKAMMQEAKDHGYRVPVNPLWDEDVTHVRGTAFTAAQNVGSKQAGSGRTTVEAPKRAGAATRADFTGTGETGSGLSSVPETQDASGQNSQLWFRPPQKLDDGQIGYPLGPTRPPKLPRTAKDFSPEPGSSGVKGDDSPPSATMLRREGSPQPETSDTQGQAALAPSSSGASPLSGHGSPLNYQPPSPLPDTFSEPSTNSFRDIADFGPTELDDIQLHRDQLRSPHPAGVAPAADALYRPANGQNGVTSKIILDASGNQAGCLGLGMLVARTAAGRPGQLDLLSASSLLHGGYADSGARRARVLDAINAIQSAEWDTSKFGARAQRLGPRDIPGYRRQLGYHSENSQQLVDALQSGFNPQTNRFGDVPRFAMLSYTFGDDVMQGFNLGHVAFVQRSFQNPNYLEDRYTYYDSARGGFSYANFGQLSQALSDYYGLAYQELGGFNSASTFFYNEEPKK